MEQGLPELYELRSRAAYELLLKLSDQPAPIKGADLADKEAAALDALCCCGLAIRRTQIEFIGARAHIRILVDAEGNYTSEALTFATAMYAQIPWPPDATDTCNLEVQAAYLTPHGLQTQGEARKWLGVGGFERFQPALNYEAPPRYVWRRVEVLRAFQPVALAAAKAEVHIHQQAAPAPSTTKSAAAEIEGKITLTAKQLGILNNLASAGRRLSQEEASEGVEGLSGSDTRQKTFEYLESQGLIDRAQGERKGYGITPLGLNHLQQE